MRGVEGRSESEKSHASDPRVAAEAAADACVARVMHMVVANAPRAWPPGSLRGRVGPQGLRRHRCAAHATAPGHREASPGTARRSTVMARSRATAADGLHRNRAARSPVQDGSSPSQARG